MKPRFFSSRSRVLFASGIASTLFFAHTASAQWLGLGAPAGSGTEITDTANWTGSVINGDFSTINTAGTHSLTLGSDIAFANGTTGAGTAVSTTLSEPSAAKATTITVVDATGIRPGYKVGGTGVVLGSYVKKVEGNVITLSFALSADTGSGSYTFTRPALDFNFGYSPVDLVSLGTGVDLQIGSSVPGTPRTISIAGTTLSTQRTAPANNVTFSQDIAFTQTAETAWGRMTGDAVSSGQTSPTVTINGPVYLGGFTTNNSRLVLEGGYMTINGVISSGETASTGTGASINFGSSDSAGVLTLTNPNNSFSRNISNNGDGALVADSVKPIGNIGELSTLGTGMVHSRISSNGKTITLKGFTVPQTTNREISLGNGRLNNDGGAPLYLTGPVINNTTTGNSSFGGTFVDYEYPNVISGLMSDPTARTTGMLAAGGVWVLTNPANTFTRNLGVSGGPGILRTDTLPNIGEGGPLGLSSVFTMSTATSGTINFIEYVGTGYDSTDRGLSFSGNISTAGGNGLLANGLGTMEISGPNSNTMTPNTSGASITRTLNLEGSGDGILSGAGSLVDNVPASGDYAGKLGKLGIAKRGAGTWTISGSGFDYSGVTNVSAGKLVFDFTNAPQLSGPSVGNMAIDFGTLEFRAKPTGVTTYNHPGQLQIGVATNFGPTNFTVNANGGDGFHLGIQTLQATSSVMRTELIDISSSAGNQVTVNEFGSAMAIVKGVIQNNASGTGVNGRASIILKDSQGYAFPTLTGGAAPGTLTRIETTDLPTSGFSANVNYLLDDAGTTTLAADLPFSTITVDSTADDITLDLAGFNLAPSGAGRGILFRGANDVTLTSTGGFASGSSFVHNHLEPGATLTIGANFTNNQPIILGGSGFTNYTGVGMPMTTGTVSDTTGLALTGGVFRFSTDQDITTEANAKFRLRAINTVIEIGADLNGVTEGDFSYGVGKDPADASSATNLNRRVVFYGNSGLSAANGKRVVNFISEGVQQPLVWGVNGFLTGSDNNRDNGYPLKLSSDRADGTIEIKNPIDLNVQSTHGRRRTVEVANGSAAIDAELSGVLSGGAGLVKTGAGTLLLSGVNTYRGDTHVRAGKLLLGNGAAAGTGRLFIDGSGSLGGTGSSGSATVSGNLAVEIDGATSSKLTVNGDLAIGGSTLTVSVLSPATQASYVIAEYTGTLSGTFGSVPSGYTVTYDGDNKRIVLNMEGGPPANAFSTYMQTAFPSSNDPLVIGAGADPDKDGLKNAIEFVLNSNPNGGSQSNLPKARKEGNNVVFEFTRRKDAATAGYPSVVQVSSTLSAGSWTDVTAGVSTVDNPGNPTVLEDVTVTIPIPGGNTKLFARLKVDVP